MSFILLCLLHFFHWGTERETASDAHMYQTDRLLSGYQRFGVSGMFWFLFLKEIHAFIPQGCIKLIKRDCKDIYDVMKRLYFK